MIKTQIFVILMSGFLLSGIAALIAFFFEPLRIIFFLIAMALLMFSLIAAQLSYAYYMMKKDAYEKAMGMKLCPHCQKPMEKEATVCPHCKENI